MVLFRFRERGPPPPSLSPSLSLSLLQYIFYPRCLLQEHVVRRAETAATHAQELEDVKKNEREAIETAKKVWPKAGRCAAACSRSHSPPPRGTHEACTLIGGKPALVQVSSVSIHRAK